ncbi:putative MFS-type transporter YhjX [Pandoraea iniqua]|uniref:Putative MFS-type transporter YhjX n=1 Tax=Pandoraea iniqua TaxID=2508288 RepID=A0A5E4TGL1_9BURK|nr:MFS transporter [Pandoraea iniqua]VVD85279.1 putative MFS-type transporter YhjX [Pandoraea iniqua]
MKQGNITSAATMPAEGTRTNQPWLMVAYATIGASVCSTAIILMTVGVFIRALGTAQGWDRAQISGALSICALSLAVATPVVGALIDRFHLRTVLVTSLLTYGATVLAVPLMVKTWGITGFFLAFFLIGVFGAGSNTIVYLRVISGWFDRSRGLALGISMAGVALGGAIAAPIAAAMIQRFGWEAGYYFLGAVPIVIGVPLSLFLLREAPTQSGVSGRAAGALGAAGRTLSQAFASRAFWLVGVAAFLMAVAINGAQIHLVPMLLDRGVALSSAAFATTVLAVAALIGRVAAGYLFDRIFAPRAAIGIFALSCVGCAGLLLTNAPASVYLCAALLGFGAGAESDLLGYLISRYFGLDHFGKIFGWVFASFMAGSAVGPVVFGMGFDASGSYAMPLYLACAALLIVCALCAMMPRYQPVQDAQVESVA